MRQLEFFIAVAREENFTRAAAASFVTQSGLSASIRALERELGAQLFDRGSYGARMTRSGEIFLPRARRMLEHARAVRQELLDEAGAPSRLVRVGSEQCLGDLVDVVDLLASFRSTVSGVEVSYVQAGSEELGALLRAGQLDLALVARSAETRTQEITPPTLLRHEPFVLVAPGQHRLSEIDAASWSEVAERAEFVDFQPTWTVRRILDRATAERGMERNSVVVVDDVHMLIEMVERGFGVAALPLSLASKEAAQGLARIPLLDDDLAWEIHVEMAADADEAARGLRAMLLPDSLVREARNDFALVRPLD